jgi:catechol 2,3-dioxygenase-like lactoylglutathione lyase family enzyme
MSGECNSPGWNEVVFSVEDLAATEQLYTEVAGWEVLHRGKACSNQAVAWNLDESTRIGEVLLGNPGEERGYVRLVTFRDVAQRQIRSSGRFWDVGGFSNVSSRVTSIKDTFGSLQKRGWVGHHDPVKYQVGPFTVIEAAATGHDGIVFSLVERIEPKLEPDALPGRFGSPFNAPQVVKDFKESLEFFVERLGFKVALETQITWQPPGANVFGLPYQIAMATPVEVAIVQPQGQVLGCIELLGPGELMGQDFSYHAKPPNLGVLAVRFPVDGLMEYIRRLEAKGVPLLMEPTEVVLEPFGTANVVAVRSPNGSWLEFYEFV